MNIMISQNVIPHERKARRLKEVIGEQKLPGNNGDCAGTSIDTKRRLDSFAAADRGVPRPGRNAQSRRLQLHGLRA
jgi:hypothetical protein